MRVLPLIVVLLLAGCASKGDVKMPEVVRVPVPTPVALPPALTAPCKQQAPKGQSWEQALVLLELRRIWLEDCAARMDRIRALQPAVSP